MAKDLTDAATENLEEGTAYGDEENASSVVENNAATGGRDLSIRRKIEERLERKRLLDELGMLDEDLDF